MGTQKRKMLRQRPPTSGSFKKGHPGFKHRGFPLARRQTNRFFAETLFHEMTALDPKIQQTEFVLIVRKAIQAAKADGQLAVRLILDVCNRFLGSPVQPIAWRDLTEQPVQRITPEMTDAEAARIVTSMLRRGNDSPEAIKAMERDLLLDDGPNGPAIDPDASYRSPALPMPVVEDNAEDIPPQCKPDEEPRRRGNGLKEAITRAQRGY